MIRKPKMCLGLTRSATSNWYPRASSWTLYHRQFQIHPQFLSLSPFDCVVVIQRNHPQFHVSNAFVTSFPRTMIDVDEFSSNLLFNLSFLSPCWFSIFTNTVLTLVPTVFPTSLTCTYNSWGLAGGFEHFGPMWWIFYIPEHYKTFCNIQHFAVCPLMDYFHFGQHSVTLVCNMHNNSLWHIRARMNLWRWTCNSRARTRNPEYPWELQEVPPSFHSLSTMFWCASRVFPLEHAKWQYLKTNIWRAIFCTAAGLRCFSDPSSFGHTNQQTYTTSTYISPNYFMDCKKGVTASKWKIAWTITFLQIYSRSVCTYRDIWYNVLSKLFKPHDLTPNSIHEPFYSSPKWRT